MAGLEPGKAAASWTGINIYHLLVVILLAGLDLRVTATRFKPLVFPDSLEYVSLARDIKSKDYFRKDFDLDQGLLISRRRPPVYPSLMALFSLACQDMEIAGAWLSIICSLAAMLALFRLGRKLDSTFAGLLAAGIFGFHHYVLIYAGAVHTEAMFTLIFACFLILSFMAYERKTFAACVLLGLVSALAYMTRDIGISLVVVACAGGIIYWRFIDRIKPARSLTLCLCILSVFAVFCLPYWIHIRIHEGQWGLTPQMANAKIAGKISTFKGDKYLRDLVPGIEIDENPATRAKSRAESGLSGVPALAKKTASLTRQYGRQFLRIQGRPISMLFWLACLIAIYRIFKERDSARSFRELYALACMAQMIVLYAVVSPYMVDERYMYPLLAPGILFASTGVSRAGNMLAGFAARQKIPAQRLARPGWIFMAFALILVYYYPRVAEVQAFASPFTMDRKLGAGYMEAANDLKEMNPPEPPKPAAVLDRKSFMAYYLGSGFEIIPRTPLELEARLEQGGVGLVSADTYTYMHTRPLMLDLAFGTKNLPGARVIYSRAFPQYRRIITVYSFAQQDPGDSEDYAAFSTQELLGRAEIMLSNDRLYRTLKITGEIIDRDKYNARAYTILARTYERYYRVTKIPGFLEGVIQNSKNSLAMRPADKNISELLEWAEKEKHYQNIKSRVIFIRAKAAEKRPERF